MYRRAAALEGLGQVREALVQAIRGREVDSKNNFDDLITKLKTKISQEQPRPHESTNRAKEISAKSGTTNSGKSSVETTMPGRDSTQKKEQAKDKSSKKKKGPSRQQQRLAAKAAAPRAGDSDVDSDSTDSDDVSQFAQRMASVQGATTGLTHKGPIKPAASQSTSSVHSNSGAGRITPGLTAKGAAGGVSQPVLYTSSK
ncbi:hypothetical protein EGW08_016759 [Elysia chlorotica]|uniref:Uncharacterized protein n=1 Tax=Elysia chlorotica TaxID=188477 RepID=A0A3S1B9S6_ELYCH|nr:hypothetical protein EGW08_016759 [Elysia chlorotica]